MCLVTKTMFYAYFRPFNCICNIFGLPKPTITAKGESLKINLWFKLWSLVIAVAFICSYSFTIHKIIDFDLKKELEFISDIIDLIVNIFILLINLVNSENICTSLHEMLDNIFKDLNMNDTILKLFAYKMYLWYLTPMVIFIICIVMEIVYKQPPFILMTRIPTFLSIMHLIMHLYLLSALIKVINHQLSRILICNGNARAPNTIFKENIRTRHFLQYIFSPSIKFIEVDDLAQFDLKFLCKLYDDLSTCVHLLERCYGLQVRSDLVPI